MKVRVMHDSDFYFESRTSLLDNKEIIEHLDNIPRRLLDMRRAHSFIKTGIAYSEATGKYYLLNLSDKTQTIIAEGPNEFTNPNYRIKPTKYTPAIGFVNYKLTKLSINVYCPRCDKTGHVSGQNERIYECSCGQRYRYGEVIEFTPIDGEGEMRKGSNV